MAIKGEFDESKHPRADDGKFGHGPGTPKQTADPEKPKTKPGAKKPKASEKFNAKPHEKEIASHRSAEAKARKASLDTKKKMAAVKARAREATPKQRAALKKRFEALKSKREELKTRALEAKAKKAEATAAMKAARAEHREKIKAARAEAKAKAKLESKPKGGKPKGKPAEKPKANTSAAPMPVKEYRDWQKSSDDKLSVQEAAAMSLYSSNIYTEINGHLRGGVDIPKFLKSKIPHVDAALAKSEAPRDMKVFRGMSAEAKHLVASLKPGTVFRDKAFMSTTISQKIAEDSFADEEESSLFHISVPKGTKMAPMVKGGQFDKELELLLPRETALMIDKIEKDSNGRTVVHARVHRESKSKASS